MPQRQRPLEASKNKPTKIKIIPDARSTHLTIRTSVKFSEQKALTSRLKTNDVRLQKCLKSLPIVGMHILGSDLYHIAPVSVGTPAGCRRLRREHECAPLWCFWPFSPIVYLSFHFPGRMQTKIFCKYVERWNYMKAKPILMIYTVEKTIWKNPI